MEIPLSLIEFKVEYSARNSDNDLVRVLRFYRKKAGATRKGAGGAELHEESILAQLALDSTKVEKLVMEFLTVRSVTIVPKPRVREGQLVC